MTEGHVPVGCHGQLVCPCTGGQAETVREFTGRNARPGGPSLQRWGSELAAELMSPTAEAMGHPPNSRTTSGKPPVAPGGTQTRVMSGRRSIQMVDCRCGVRTVLPVALLAAVLLPLSHVAGAVAASTTIVASPGPFESIQKAAVSEQDVNFRDKHAVDDTACTESFAAAELRRFLAACLDIDEEAIQLSPPNRLPAEGDVFLLGSRSSNPLIDQVDPRADKSKSLRSPESFHLHALAKDGRTVTVIEGGGRVGTLYGVYAWLERLGMRFYGLGQQGTVYPTKPATLPGELDVTEEPKFLTRGFLGCTNRGNREFFLWMARNRMNYWIAVEDNVPFLKKLGMKLDAGGHSIQSDFLGPQTEYPYNHPRFDGDDSKPADPYAVSPQYLGDADGSKKLSYAEAHPEWYAQHDGKRDAHRQPTLRYNTCTSNADAGRELARNLTANLIDGPYRDADVINFMMLDHGPWCECDGCARQGSPTDRMLDLQYRVHKDIQAARREGRLHRNIQLVSLAYLETLPAPTRPLPADFDYENCLVTFYPISRCYAHPLADPTCTEINRHTLACYQNWALTGDRFYKGGLFIGEYYNVSSIKTLPVVYTRILATDIPWYYRSGVRHFHYMHTPTSLWGTWTINQHLLAKLLWNPDADADALLDDYFHLYYPTTSERMRAFYGHLESATANIKAYKHHVWVGNAYHCLPGKLDSGDKDLFPMDHLHYQAHHPLLNDAPDVVDIIELMRLARQDIDAALVECGDPTERARLLEDERRFAYGEAMFGFLYHLVRISLFDQRGEQAAARREFVAVERMAERLRGVVDLVQVAYRHANAKDGLEASQAAPAYEAFKKKYGVAATRQGP